MIACVNICYACLPAQQPIHMIANNARQIRSGNVTMCVRQMRSENSR